MSRPKPAPPAAPKPAPKQAAGELDPHDVQTISDWLVRQGLRTAEFDTMFGGFCERLGAAGVPLWRGQVSMRTLHPSIEAVAYIWRPETAVESAPFYYGDADSDEFLHSPFHHILETGARRLRHRLGDGETGNFPILEEFRAAGATDYYARLVPFTFEPGERRRGGVITSWVSDRPGGFSDGHIATLDRLLPRLGLSLKATLTYQFAVNLLDTYVGRDAGRRIRSGEIRRGHAEIIRAVVWYADLRGFTALTDEMAPDALLATLDEYYNCMVYPLTGRGGQVLKFIGDGLLATFDLEGKGRDAVCREALDAAVEALELVRRLNDERSASGQPVMELDLALHLGDVMYGNVGALDRQDFTVIGPAVNEAARIEAQCELLQRHILLSETFADAAAQCSARLVSLGRHRLRGVREAQELFTLKDEDGDGDGDG